MRVGIFAPKYHSEETGNAVTVRRIEGHLRLLGCEVRVFPVDRLSGERLVAEVAAFNPQLLHAFHGFLGGRPAHAVAGMLSIPYLITLTGSDVYQALSDKRSHDTHLALRGAARLVAFHASIKGRVAEHLPTLEERTVVIPQGVEVLPEPPGAGEKNRDVFTFLIPAGLRPVKNVLLPLQPLAMLHDDYPQVRLQLVGPVLDNAYATEVLDAFEQQPFASYLGKVAHEAMAALYRAADVVVNSSIFEGGMANSILEALAYGKPVLASDIEGNRSIIREGATGLLFHDAADFLAKARQLVADPHLCRRLGTNGSALVREKHSPEKEALAYLALYREILSQ